MQFTNLGKLKVEKSPKEDSPISSLANDKPFPRQIVSPVNKNFNFSAFSNKSPRLGQIP